MTFRSVAAVVALTILAAPVALDAQPKATSVKFGTKVLSHTGRLDDHALSPDGKWIAALSQTASSNTVVIAPATGGTFRPLVPTTDRPLQAVWSPRGDRVAYMSERIGGVVIADFDASTGALRGTPKRVTLERAAQYTIAPDGQSLAYVFAVGKERVLKVVPVDGGTARELIRYTANGIDYLHFTGDGKSLYYSVRSPTTMGVAYRVSIAGGGEPELVWKPATVAGSPRGFTNVDPSIGRIVRTTNDAITFMTLQGDTVLVLPGVDGGATSAFSADGRSMFVAPSDVRTIIRAVPLDGGKPIDLSTDKEYAWPLAWSSDNKTAYYLDSDSKTMLATNLDGSVRRSVPLDPQPRPATFDDMEIEGVSGDGRQLYVTEQVGRAGLRRAYLYDPQTRALRTLTDSLGSFIAGRGGRYLPYHHEIGEFLFLQRTGGTAGHLDELPREIRAAKPSGTSRLVRRVPSASDLATNFMVDGDRVYWMVTRSDTAALFLARGTAPAVKIWSTTERMLMALLSNDGTRMAVAVRQPLANGLDRVRVQFLRIDASGRVTNDGTSATVGSFYDAYWAPDDQSLVALEYPAADLDTRLVRIPTNGGAVSYIVKPGTMTFWDHYLSPDGKYSLLPAESPRGATVWRIDLAAAERDWKQRRGSK